MIVTCSDESGFSECFILVNPSSKNGFTHSKFTVRVRDRIRFLKCNLLQPAASLLVIFL